MLLRRLMLACVLLPLCAAFGDGFIIIERPPPEPMPVPVQHFPLQVKFHKVECTIRGQLATTSVDQIFHNPSGVQLEGTYIFPLPVEATVAQFSMWMGDQEVQGEILEAGKAREIYEGIVRSMKDPALLEYIGRGMFKARVFPIPAHGDVRVRLTYNEVLPSTQGLVAYRYPLNTEKFSSSPIESVSLLIDIDTDLPLQTVYSPSHDVDILRRDGRVKISYEEKNTKPDKDFMLYYSSGEDPLGMSLLTWDNGEDGHFLLLLSPNQGEEIEAAPKDVVFVLDTSGSMVGPKLEQAKRALAYGLQNLAAKDRFAVIDFATGVRPFSSRLLEASPGNIEKALARVEELRARGGTALHEAVEAAYGMFGEGDQRGIVVFITDGEPTIGLTDPDEILKRSADVRVSRVRFFSFGIGTELDTHLLDQLASQGRGDREYALPEENLEIKASAFFDKVSYPVLTDVVLSFDGIETYDVYPKQMPDIFMGGQISVVGKYRPGEGSQAFRLTGRQGAEQVEAVYESKFAGRDDSSVGRIWARRKVGYLLDEIRLHGESQELRDEVIQLSIEFGIMTPYTSYLVVEDESQLAQTNLRRAFNGEPAPAAPGFGGSISPDSDAPMREALDRLEEAEKAGESRGGRLGVEFSLELKRLQGGKDDGEDDMAIAAHFMRKIGSETYYLQDAAWVSQRVLNKEVSRTVTFLSDEYFELLSNHPELGAVLALGEQVRFELNGEVVAVVVE